jgi:hypothetical protein
METVLPGWATHWQYVGWPFYIPFLCYLARATVWVFLLFIPRNHPRRDLLILATLLYALATDLVDGTVARKLHMTGLHAVSYGDLIGDLGYWVGSALVLRFEVTLVRDLPAPPPGTRRRSPPLLDAFWIVASLALAAEIYGLIMNRTLSW